MADRSVLVRVKADISDYNRKLLEGAAATKAFTKELDTSTDRATNLTQSILAIGPALVPIGAAAVPAISGLTNQMAFAAAGAGVAALAFSGVGDALKATNDYAVDPSVANFQKMSETLAELGPAGRDFVTYLQDIRPQLQDLQDIAQEGLLPGAQEGIESLMTLMPQVERIVGQISTALGDLMSEAGDNLADPRWQDFFTFLENEARPTLIDMGRTLGNFGEGFANLWMAFDPLSDQFSHSFLQMSRDFAQWTDGLSETEGFQEFVDYIQSAGPKAWDALTALGNALLQVVEAAAPVGEAVLPVITVLADTLAAVADSPVGPVLIGAAAGLSAVSRAVALYDTANGSALAGMFSKSTLGGAARAAKDLPAAARGFLQFDAAAARASMTAEQFAVANGRLGRSLGGAAKLAGGAGGLAFMMSDLDDKMGVSNTAMGVMTGSLVGPWGAAVGAAIGATMDLAAANDDLWAAINRASSMTENGSGTIEQQRAAVEAARKELADFKDDIGSVSGFDVINLGGIKNSVKGLFGDSDVDEANAALADLEAQTEENARAAQDLQFEQAGLGDSMDDASDATRKQVQATLDLIGVHNELSDILLQERGGVRAYEAALDDARAAAKKNGRAISEGTEAGRANNEALDRLADAWNKLTPAQQSASGSANRARRAFINTAESMGYSKSEARKLADALLEIPDNTKADVHTNADAERRKLMLLQGYIDGMHGKTVKVKVEGGTPGGITAASANGNIIDYYANGGIRRENHIAMIAPAGSTQRVWNEPETGGEAYIPFAESKRERSIDIWAETGRRLGVTGFDGGKVQRFADGGTVATLPAPASHGSHSGMSAAQFERVLTRVLSNGSVRIVGKPGSQRLEIYGG